MADIKITDNAGLSLTFPAGPGSAFARYLRSSTPISLQLKEKQVSGGLLSQLIPTGLSFTDKLKLGGAAQELTVKAGVEGSVSLKTGAMFDPDKDDFGDSLKIPEGQAYLGAGFKATVEGGLTDTSGNLKFGVTASSTLTLMNYALFPASNPVGEAMQKVLQYFIIPGDLKDIKNMKNGTIATAEGSGSIKFSFKGSYPLLTNPMATVASGPLKGFSAGTGGLSVAVTGGVTGDYQIRVRKIDPQTFELSYEKKKGSSLTVTLQAQIGPSASVDGYDVLKALMQAISKDPVVDKNTFGKQTGLNDDEIAAIAAAVKAGIDRSLSLAITNELSLAAESDAAFTYQVDLRKLDKEGEECVQEALTGDLRKIEGQDFAGIKRLRSVFLSMRESKSVFKVNLLGIYNFGSVTDLIKQGRMVVDRETGAISILDKASASRVGFTADNFAASSKKLRAVVATGVTMTAGYTIAKSLPQPPNFKCGCWFFEEHQQSNHANISKYVRDVAALDLVLPTKVAAQLQTISKLPDDQLGPSTFLMESTYETAAFRAMFLNSSNKPRALEDYLGIGREGLVFLLKDDPRNLVRVHVLRDLDLYAQFTHVGSEPAVAAILNQHGITDELHQRLIYDDYILISWWAGDMAKLAQRVSELLAFLGSNPKPDAKNKTLKNLRDRLNSSMKAVASRTSAHYIDNVGGPWGMRVMANASGLRDSSIITEVSRYLAFTVSRNPALRAKT